MIKVESTLEAYYKGLPIFKEEALLLRKMLLGNGLQEDVKWGSPIFTLNGKNVIGLGVFKSYCGLWFFKGASLKDELGLLVSGSEKTHTQKQWRFTNKKEINVKLVNAYIKEAIALEKSGVKIDRGPKPLIIDPLFQQALSDDKVLDQAWSKLSLSCKREYTDYINEAKKEETKLKRIEKMAPKILEAKGLHDKYK